MKSILAVCAFMVSTTSAFADFIDCRRDDAAIAGGAAGAAWGGDHGIVKSWMPTQIWIDEEKMNMALRIIKILRSHFAKTGTVTNSMPVLNGRALRVLPMP